MDKENKYVQSGTENWKNSSIQYGHTTGNRRVAIVVPAYKEADKIRSHETASIKQCVKIFKDFYDIILVTPDTLNIEGYKKLCDYDFSRLGLNPDFFRRQKSYSNLCERYEFYECFKEYQYILIYQLDAWVFSNKMEHFIDLGYDYIGGVHLTPPQNGNGGFSLRKVSKFIEVCHTTDWSKVPRMQLEDCAFTQKFKSRFNLAPLGVCYEFSWQENPTRGMKENNNQLPFGCHAFHRFGAMFWKKYITY